MTNALAYYSFTVVKSFTALAYEEKENNIIVLWRNKKGEKKEKRILAFKEERRDLKILEDTSSKIHSSVSQNKKPSELIQTSCYLRFVTNVAIPSSILTLKVVRGTC